MSGRAPTLDWYQNHLGDGCCSRKGTNLHVIVSSILSETNYRHLPWLWSHIIPPCLKRKWKACKHWRPLLLNNPTALLLSGLFSSKTGSFFTALLEKNEGRAGCEVEIGESNSFRSLSGTEKHSHHHHLEAALVRPQSWKWLKALTAPRHVEDWSESQVIMETERLPA